ncbi:ABC transporter ATP-binding protein [Uliginosibacterium gangwonense]|uniref:ABC transporter ATP-binding protein n=1 Tax=Uliginosibacterium gangwonense TaxID=392736 RepID=UPI0003609E8A|nr:ABC transporter ATP-binding protein [Uliginosibacterium gangwonense]
MKHMPAPDTLPFRDLPRALWFFLAEERWRFLFFMLVLILVLFYGMVPPYLIGLIANFLIGYVKAPAELKPSVHTLYTLVGTLAVCHALIALIRLSSKRVLGMISLNARYRAKVWGFERLLDFSLAWHQQENTGNKAQRILTGAEAVREWTGEMFNNLLAASTAFIGALIACSVLHPAFALFFLYFLGVLVSIELYFDYRISRISDQINRSMENASGSFVESASNILAVKALGAAESMSNNVAQREEMARLLGHERLRLGNTKWMCFQIHNALSWGAYLVAVAYMVMHGRLEAGFFLTYAVYFDRLRESSIDFTDRIQLMIERKSNLARMMPFFWGNNAQVKGTQAFPKDWQSIRLQEVSFRYGDKPAVGPMSLEIPRGQVVGIAGHSGSGKSTLIKLLLGLYQVEAGRLDIGKVAVADIRHEELTSNVAVVLQETELFNLSLLENICMMREVDSVLLERACRVACLDDLIARLPDGLQTMVGEKGSTLSGGERQRIGIARALYRNAPILLLDEATSALDSVTEQKVMDALMAERVTGVTMLIVAHRISTLKDADRILVFERGQIVEEGGFAALSHDPASRFGGMFAIQAA